MIALHVEHCLANREPLGQARVCTCLRWPIGLDAEVWEIISQTAAAASALQFACGEGVPREIEWVISFPCWISPGWVSRSIEAYWMRLASGTSDGLAHS